LLQVNPLGDFLIDGNTQRFRRLQSDSQAIWNSFIKTARIGPAIDLQSDRCPIDKGDRVIAFEDFMLHGSTLHGLPIGTNSIGIETLSRVLTHNPARR
jgi:hypothetical protein